MKNGNETWNVLESVTVARGQRKENTDRVKNQLDCRIRYRALLKNIYIYLLNQ